MVLAMLLTAVTAILCLVAIFVPQSAGILLVAVGVAALVSTFLWGTK
jgi:hypothetical protein